MCEFPDTKPYEALEVLTVPKYVFRLSKLELFFALHSLLAVLGNRFTHDEDCTTGKS